MMDKSKCLREIMGRSDAEKIVIYTEHYKIIGTVYECDECNKEAFLNLTNVKLCQLSKVYENEVCDEYSSSSHDWLHVNFDKIVAFSFVK